jgi:hypothetical protein
MPRPTAPRTPPKPPPPSEAAILKACLAVLGARGIFAWRNNVGSFSGSYGGKTRFVKFGFPGASDIFAVLPGGCFLAIEVKRPGNRPTITQRAFLRAVNEQGGVGVCVSSAAHLETILDYVLAGARVAVGDDGTVTIEGVS